MSEVKLPQFPMGVQVSGEDMIPAAQNGTSGLIKVKDVRNIGSTVAEGGLEKTASNENLKSVNKKVDDLSSAIDTSIQGINQNFTNVGNEIQSTNTAIGTANQNITNHEEDSSVHVTLEKKTEWNKNTSDIVNINASLSEMMKDNLLINGDFQVWQRGTSFSIPSGTSMYTSDRINVYSSQPITVSKGASGNLEINNTTAFTDKCRVIHPIEVPSQLKGKVVTLSIQIFSSLGNRKIGLYAMNPGGTIT